MVSTTFVNWIANSLSTAINRVDLQLVGFSHCAQLGFYNTRSFDIICPPKNDRKLLLALGGIRFGQTRTTTLFVKTPDPHRAKLNILFKADGKQIPYEVTLGDAKSIPNVQHFSYGNAESNFDNAPAVDGLLGGVLRAIEGAPSDRKSATDEIYRISEQLKDMAKNSTLAAERAAASALAKDLVDDEANHGQVCKALANPTWWAQWGAHYLRAFASAHQNQICANFKDQSLQAYTEPLFCQLRSEIEQIYADLPVPSPSLSNFRGNAQQFQQSTYTPTGPCFGGDGRVNLLNGIWKFIKDLRAGDVISNSDGDTATIQCIIRTKVQGGSTWMVRRGDMLVTPYHPVRIGQQKRWVFPADVSEPQLLPIDFVYNFVLDRKHIITISGQDSITLGHGFVGNPVVEHPFFGTDAIVQHLKTLPGWSIGFVEIERYAPIFDHAGRIISF